MNISVAKIPLNVDLDVPPQEFPGYFVHKHILSSPFVWRSEKVKLYYTPEQERCGISGVDQIYRDIWSTINQIGSISRDSVQAPRIMRNLGPGIHNFLYGKPSTPEAIKVFNANILDFLLANKYLIPDEWKDKYVFFWGTIYIDNRTYPGRKVATGEKCVRYLLWADGDWHGAMTSDMRWCTSISSPALVRCR